MGMFSSPDHPSKRALFYFGDVTDTNQRWQIIFTEVSDTFRQLETNLLILPSPHQRKQFQAYLKAHQWRIVNSTDTAVFVAEMSEPTTEHPFPVATLEVELWKMHHIDKTTNTLQTQLAQRFSLAL